MCFDIAFVKQQYHIIQYFSRYKQNKAKKKKKNFAVVYINKIIL